MRGYVKLQECSYNYYILYYQIMTSVFGLDQHAKPQHNPAKHRRYRRRPISIERSAVKRHLVPWRPVPGLKSAHKLYLDLFGRLIKKEGTISMKTKVSFGFSIGTWARPSLLDLKF